jgi:hypothetical protein
MSDKINFNGKEHDLADEQSQYAIIASNLTAFRKTFQFMLFCATPFPVIKMALWVGVINSAGRMVLFLSKEDAEEILACLELTKQDAITKLEALDGNKTAKGQTAKNLAQTMKRAKF